MEVKKYNKIEAIKKAIEGLGKAPADIIHSHVLAILSLDQESYPSSSFKRHLKELVDQSEIMHEEDGTRFLYSLVTNGQSVIGAKLFELRGGNILASSLIANAIQVSTGMQLNIDQKYVFISCELMDKIFTIRCERDMFPMSFVFHRRVPNTDKVDIALFEKNLGSKRIVSVEIPDPKISRSKDSTFFGHAVFTFNQDGKFHITDLASGNGVYYHFCSNEEANQLLNTSLKTNQDTLLQDQQNQALDIHFKERVPPNEPLCLELPVLVGLSKSFKILVNS